MAEPQCSDGSSASGVSIGNSDSTIQLNIKTLDSRIYSFHVDKNIIVSAFKEKIANQCGVPVAQQRLIFRGKVLKDHHLLSEYNVENGDTLHLVERQPQLRTSADPPPGDGVRGHDSNVTGPRNHITPIAQSIVLGTLNIGDPADGAAPDLNRIIGAVLNTVGIGLQPGGVQHGVPTFHANGAEASRPDPRRDGNASASVSSHTSQAQSASRAIPIPLGAAISVPSLHMPIPDSLNTLVEFISRMELVFSQNGRQPIQSTPASDDRPAGELPLNSRGLPTVEALRIVLHRVQTLLSNHAVPALSQTADHLSEEAATNDPTARGQMQMESVQLGMAMQHLGALFLELGRTVLTLRLGRSSGESSVNAGPAVYISASGPNPIMVQPFPLQTSSLFGASMGVSANHVTVNQAGVSTIPRNVNIHIHTGGGSLGPAVSIAANRESNGGASEEPGSATRPNESGLSHGLSGITSSATVPSTQAPPLSSGVASPVTIVQQIREIDVRNLFPNSQTNSSVGEAEGSTSQGHVGSRGDDMMQNDVNKGGSSLNSSVEPSPGLDGRSNEGSIASNQGVTDSGGSSNIPLGLGLGGLQPKRQARQVRSQVRGTDGSSSMGQRQQSRAVGQQVLRSLASLASGGNSTSPVETPASAVGATAPTTNQNMNDQSPALDGLLAGVSQQTGVGSPDIFRSVLQQFTENPTLRNTMNQIAQQVDSHELGNMFSGFEAGPGGAIDLSRMMQQMMPIVSQALGGISSGSRRASTEPPRSESGPRREMDLQQRVQTRDNQASPQDLLHALIDRAVNVSSVGISSESINELCSNQELIQEFMESLHHDLSERLEEEKGP